MINLILILIILSIIIIAFLYIIKSIKNGNSCIGCPYAKSCKKNKKK